MDTEAVFCETLGRDVFLRPGTSDRQVFADTFGGAGRYHVPPPEMPVPSTVLDLGANIGLTAAHYAALWPDAHVVAVEMDRPNAELARQNFKGQVVHCAVSDRVGFGRYGLSAAAEAYSLGDQGEIRVRTRPLLTLIAHFFDGMRVVDFAKFDVEAAEWRIFAQSDWSPFVRHLLVELHPDSDHPDDSELLVAMAIADLHRLGYQARHHPPHPRAVFAWR